jgi:hypothetical protein
VQDVLVAMVSIEMKMVYARLATLLAQAVQGPPLGNVLGVMLSMFFTKASVDMTLVRLE